MSIRTIIELNHDYAHRIEADTQFTDLLSEALRTGSEQAWETLRRYGVTRLAQAHHSDERQVLINGRSSSPRGNE